MTKIALVLGGSGSLGTYAAGAVTELFRALSDEHSGGSAPIGVMAGVSSGGLNAALAARALVVNPSLVPWIRTFWIRGMDIEVLLNQKRSSRSSLLDVSALEKMSRALIAAEPASDDRSSSLLAQPFELGMTLTSLHGVTRRAGSRSRDDGAPPCAERLYDDWVAFRLSPEDAAGAPVWQDVLQAAVAATSFPPAFPARRLERPRGHPSGSTAEDGGAIDMWYGDGGLLANEPLRLAKRLVVRTGTPEDDWRYVVVDPTFGPAAQSDPGGAAPPTSFARVAGLLAKALPEHGSSGDRLRAAATNDRLALVHALIGRLPEIAAPLTDPEEFELSRSVGELAEQVCEARLADSGGGRGRSPARGRAGADPVLELLEESLARVERRHARVLARIGSRAARSRLAKLIFLIEASAGLDDKEALAIHTIAPRRRLAGDFLGGFGGLFCREWREADFAAGRRDARQLLETAMADLTSYEPDEESAYDVPELDTSMDALEPDRRRVLDRVIEAEVGWRIGQLDAGFLGNLLGFAWKPALRKRAFAEAMRTLRDAS